MSYFYFDESIHRRANFIAGAWVYSESDLTPKVFTALQRAGLQPGLDEFKSGAPMKGHPERIRARGELQGLIMDVNVGLIVAPATDRSRLGEYALIGLQKLIERNNLGQVRYRAYLDQGISMPKSILSEFSSRIAFECEVFPGQDSKQIGGIQLADLAAHSMGTMLLDHQGHIQKTVKAGEGSGYEPDLDINLGFELWASLRYSFFRSLDPISSDEDPLDSMTFDVANYGLYIASTCESSLRTATIGRFGKCYLGCIH